jgi:hypothetical protein
MSLYIGKDGEIPSQMGENHGSFLSVRVVVPMIMVMIMRVVTVRMVVAVAWAVGMTMDFRNVMEGIVGCILTLANRDFYPDNPFHI